MSKKKVVVLDGTGDGDEDLAAPFGALREVLDRDGADVRRYHLKDIKLGHCIGCFGCWVKTPGVCVIADQGRDIVREVIQSDVTVLFTAVTFGGYSSALKVVVDRFIPLILPFVGKFHGETHHTRRYERYPRLVGIGVQRQYDEAEARIFRAVVGRNAINFHAPSFAADVLSLEVNEESLRKRLKDTLSRSDPLPEKDDIVPFLPGPGVAASEHEKEESRNALLIVGSPKVKSRSGSSILGEYLTAILEANGWNTETLMLKRSRNEEAGQAELCAAIDRSNLIILAFPLYIDALPCLLTKAFEVIAQHRKTVQAPRPQRLFTLINNGFPGAHQNALALAICRRFADQSGMSWAGLLAIGAGEALVGGQALTEPKRLGPPVKHVIEALDAAGADLAQGGAVSPDTQSLVSRVPIPMVSFGIWRWLFDRLAARQWMRHARKNGVSKEEMDLKPYVV